MWSLNVRKSSLRPLITLVSWLRFWNLKWQTLIYLSLTGWSNSQAHERATYLTSSSTPQPFSQSAITATDVFTYCFVPWAHGGYNQPNAYYNLGKKRCRGTRCCWDPNVLYPPNCVISGLSFESFQSFYHYPLQVIRMYCAGEELPPEEMERLILSTERIPHQRTTLYGDAPAQQRIKAFSAQPLLKT